MTVPNGPLREELRRLARATDGGLLTVGVATRVLENNPRSAALRLGALARSGWLVRVRRGLYYVPPIDAGEIPAVEDSFLLANALYAPCYIGGWSAAEHWGLTEQIFQETFVATGANVRSRAQTKLGTRFRLTSISVTRVQSVATSWRGHVRLRISSPERTIADACLDPHWVGGMRHLAQIVAEYRDSKGASADRLVEELFVIGKGAAWKRAGFLAELVWPEASVVVRAALRERSAGVVRLDPTIPNRGRMNRRWGLWINAELPLMAAAS